MNNDTIFPAVAFLTFLTSAIVFIVSFIGYIDYWNSCSCGCLSTIYLSVTLTDLAGALFYYLSINDPPSLFSFGVGISPLSGMCLDDGDGFLQYEIYF